MSSNLCVSLVLVTWLAAGTAFGAVAESAPPPAVAATVEAESEAPGGSGVAGSEIDRAWFGSSEGLGARARTVRLRARALGAENLDAAARALAAPFAPQAGLGTAMLAVRLAPDLPLAHVALARAHWNEGAYAPALQAAVDGVLAIPRHLEAALWLASSLLVMFATLLILAPVVFVAGLGASVFRHAAHDLGDLVSRQMPAFARTALLGGVLLVPLLLGEGLMGVLLVLFAMAFAYGGARHRMVLGLAAALLVIGLYPMARLAAMAASAIDSAPVAVSALAVVQGMETRLDLERLSAASDTDPLADHALALHARRWGRVDEATERHAALLEKHPHDPVIVANVANLRFQAGDTEGAIELYERAARLVDSGVLMFNLSQAYARAFRMEEFEGALRKAQSLEPEAVEELSQTGDPNFVADLAFPVWEIRDRLISAADAGRISAALNRPPFSGRVGQGWLPTAGAFLAAAFLSMLVGGRYEHSSTCSRCGRRICARCDGTVWNSEICNGCHHLFHRPETTDPALRTARVASLRARERRIERIATAASLFVPGVSGLLARRPDLAFVGVLLFCFAGVTLMWRDGVVPDPLAVGAVGSLAFVAMGVCSLLAYLLVVMVSLMIRRNL